MIHILPNLYCVQYFSTVPFDGSSTTVLVGNFRTPYKIAVILPLCFADSLQASKLHNLSIHWNHHLASLFSIISCWISTKLPPMWVYSSYYCVCAFLLTSERKQLWNHNWYVWCMISVEFCTVPYSTVRRCSTVLYRTVWVRRCCTVLYPTVRYVVAVQYRVTVFSYSAGWVV